jgi:hypothetical protein
MVVTRFLFFYPTGPTFQPPPPVAPMMFGFGFGGAYPPPDPGPIAGMCCCWWCCCLDFCFFPHYFLDHLPKTEKLKTSEFMFINPDDEKEDQDAEKKLLQMS